MVVVVAVVSVASVNKSSFNGELFIQVFPLIKRRVTLAFINLLESEHVLTAVVVTVLLMLLASSKCPGATQSFESVRYFQPPCSQACQSFSVSFLIIMLDAISKP